MRKEMVAPIEDVKEMLDEKERVRQDHNLIKIIYEMVVDLQYNLKMDRQENKIKEMRDQVERLNKEIKYIEEDKRYIETRRHELLREIY